MTTKRRDHRNFWYCSSDPLFVWQVVFDWTRVAPEELVWWAGEALVALSETGIYEVFALPEIGYASPSADPRALAALIADRYRREGVIDLLHFDNAASYGAPEDCAIASSLAYYGDHDAIVTEDVRDMGALQMKTQPWLDEMVDSVYHRKPVVLRGALFAPHRPNFPSENVGYNPKRVYLQVETYTDIWLPTVPGMNETGTEFDWKRRLPNAELSALNGARLNEAIRRLRELTAAVGGAWEVSEDYLGALPLGEFTEAGVNLAGGTPAPAVRGE